VGVRDAAHVRLPKYEEHTNGLREVRSWRWDSIAVQLPDEGRIARSVFQSVQKRILSRCQLLCR
jgi:hypothetical protein